MTTAAKDDLHSPATRIAALHVQRPRLFGRLLLTVALIGLAARLAPDLRAAPALATLVAILCFIFLFPSFMGIPSHVWGPVLGASALLLLAHGPLSASTLDAPRLPWPAVWDELTGHLGVPVLVLCFAYLSISLDDSGFFNWCSLRLMRAGRGDGRRLMVSLFLGVSVITFFTSNDIVILTMTPILLYLGNHARIRNLVPFLMAQFIAANTASMGLYVGNPTNMVVGNAVGLGFVEYAQRMLVPTLVATLVALSVVLLLFTRLSRVNRVPERYALPAPTDGERWTRQMTIKVGVFATCLGLLSIFGTPWLVGQLLNTGDRLALRRTIPNLIVAVSVGSALLAVGLDAAHDRARGRTSLHAELFGRLRRLPLDVVPFFLSFCLVLRSLEEAGLTRFAVERVLDAFEYGPVLGSLATGMFAVLAVNLTNNIPATILFEKTWLGSPSASPPIVGLAERLPELGSAYAEIFVDGVLFGSNFGANLTFIGALAGLMWLKIIRQHAPRAPEVQQLPTARDFLTYGLCIVPIVTTVTCLAIAATRLWQ